MPNAVTVYPSKIKKIPLLLSLLGYAFVCVYVPFFMDGIPFFIKALLVLSAPLFVFTFVFFVKRTLNPTPVLYATQDGISLDCVPLTWKFIPWGDIKSINMGLRHKKKVIEIELHDPDKYWEQLNFQQKSTAQKYLATGNQLVCVSLASTRTKPHQILPTLQALHAANGYTRLNNTTV